MASINLPQYGEATWAAPVSTALALPAVGNTIADARVAKDTGVIYVWDGTSWTSPSGSGTVTSVGLTDSTGLLTISGTPVTGAGNLNISAIQYASASTDGVISQSDWSTFSGKQGPINGNYNNNSVLGTDGSGTLQAIPSWGINNAGGITINPNTQPNNAGGAQVNQVILNLDPLQNSPTDDYTALTVSSNVDYNSTGFDVNRVQALALNHSHQGTGNVGDVSLINSYVNLGNGTDPITIGGLSYAYGFGNINANTTLNGPIQGYGFQPNAHSSVVLNNPAYINAFYDNANLPITVNSYNSYTAGPTIAAVKNNNSYTGFAVGPNITALNGNAFMQGLSIYPTIGTTNTGGFTGVNVNPTINDNKNYSVGLQVDMVTNVTNAAGASASKVVQDLTYTMNSVGTDGNLITIEYTNTTTAGNEVATFVNPNIVVSIESGVSTATQVKAAIDANFTLAANLTCTISGTASNPQTTYAQANFTGGINAGRAQAAWFKGDVQIEGALSFTGALSVGNINAYAIKDLTTATPGFNSIDSLITAPFVGNNVTVSGVDLLGINTAMLLNIGTNSTVTSNFLGYSALCLPAVLSMGSGSTIDKVSGATFAISLDSAATGGTASEVSLCQALAIPNGVTTVTKLIGYKFDVPFGDPGTTTYGVYVVPTTAHNYFASNVLVGSDLPTNSSVGIELNSTSKAIMNARMTTTQKNALTAAAGMMVYDTTLNQLSYYNGTTWVNV